jgi:uncharacterized membrane protein
VSNTTIDIDPKDYTIDRSGPARPASSPGRDKAKLTQAFVTTAAAVGVITAGVALIEAALIPGLLIGGAAVLAPKYLSGFLPGLRRRRQPPRKPTSRRQTASPDRPGIKALPTILVTSPVKSPVKSFVQPSIKQAIAKTITFRIIVTTLDFSVNYFVIGELATAAGLSAVSLVVGPLFYLAHETVWNRYAASDERIGLGFLQPSQPQAKTSREAKTSLWEGFTISRALAKTITFRTIATTMDFTMNFVVVGDLATAAALSASGFILGPFVYLGHEMAWDYYRSNNELLPELPALGNLLPAPG